MNIDGWGLAGVIATVAVAVFQEFRVAQERYKRRLEEEQNRLDGAQSRLEIQQLQRCLRAVAGLADEYRLDTSADSLQAVLRSMAYQTKTLVPVGLDDLSDSTGNQIFGGGAVNRFERDERVKKVYLFTREFKPDIDDERIRLTVENNLNRNVCYTYLFQGNMVSESQQSQFGKRFNLRNPARSRLVTFAALTESQFPDKTSARNVIYFTTEDDELLACFVHLTSMKRNTIAYWEYQGGDEARRYWDHLVQTLVETPPSPLNEVMSKKSSPAHAAPEEE